MSEAFNNDYLEYEQEISVLDLQLKHVEFIPDHYLKDHHETFVELRERLNILVERAQ